MMRSAVATPEAMGSKYMLHRRSGSQHLTVLIPILMAYLCLAFYRLGHQSLWVDEVFSLMRADLQGAFFERPAWFAGHGPVYFRLLHLWAGWGTSEFALRTLSVLVGGVTVCLAYAMGLRLYNRRVACIGTVLLATSPFFIWYSQEVRYVMLMMAAALLAMYTFHRALAAKRSAWWLLYGSSLVLAIGVFVVNVFLPVAQGLYLLCSPAHRPQLRRWVACQLVVFVLFAWWANYGYVTELGGYWQRLYVHATSSPETRASIDPTERLETGNAREFTPLGLPYTFFTFSVGYSLGPSIEELRFTRSLSALLPHAPVLVLCGLLFGGLFVFGLFALRRQPDTAKFLVAWLTVPLLGTFAISALIPEMPYNVRYVAMGFPAYIFILAAGIAGSRRQLLQGVLFAAVLLVNGLSLANYYFNPDYGREDTRSAAQYLETAVDPHDALVIVGSGYVFRHYYRRQSGGFSVGKALINDQAALAKRFEELAKDHEQLWLVSIRPWRVDPKGITRALLDDRYTLIEQRELPGVEIHSYLLR
jgi:4-amino-4-deoxy-L-arabinose transferase-like glycosyltransferase